MNTKKIIKTSAIILALILVFTAVFLVINKFSNPVIADAPRNIPGPELKVGRYYIDGDTEQYYLEVSPEGTIQLKDVDYFEYASYGNESRLNSLTGKELDDFKALIQKNADDYAKAVKYRSITYPAMDNMSFILRSWSEDEMGNVSGPGYQYIDENTLLGGGKTADSQEIYKYVDENTVSTMSETGKTTRIVDSLTYKKNHAN